MNKTKDEKRECCICKNGFFKYETFETIEGIMCENCLQERIKEIQTSSDLSLDYLNSVCTNYLDYCIQNLKEEEQNELKEYLIIKLLECDLLKEINQEFLNDTEYLNYIKSYLLK